jgi:DNA-binding transcriptional regulator GbsR (MarR family)
MNNLFTHNKLNIPQLAKQVKLSRTTLSKCLIKTEKSNILFRSRKKRKKTHSAGTAGNYLNPFSTSLNKLAGQDRTVFDFFII